MIKNPNPATQTHAKKNNKMKIGTHQRHSPADRKIRTQENSPNLTHTHTQISLFVFCSNFFFVVRALEACLWKREESPRHAADLGST
jgi:hypothetical protein